MRIREEDRGSFKRKAAGMRLERKGGGGKCVKNKGLKDAHCLERRMIRQKKDK